MPQRIIPNCPNNALTSVSGGVREFKRTTRIIHEADE